LFEPPPQAAIINTIATVARYLIAAQYSHGVLGEEDKF